MDRLPQQREVPEIFQACAKFVSVDPETADVSKAEGPASSTTAAQQEREAADPDDAAGSVPWLSVLDDDQTQTSELSKIPALQGCLEKMEKQAARVVANEVQALVAEGGYGALDEVGRERLQQICKDFHAQCKHVSREAELRDLQWKIQALATNHGHSEDAEDTTMNAARSSSSRSEAPPMNPGDASRPAQLRVPTTRQPYSWWDPKYWSVARPTDFCYG